MISIRQALVRLSRVRPHLLVESLPLSSAVGRTLAQAIPAPIDFPPFSRAAMDGYAVRAQDTQTPPVRLPVKGLVAAGQTLDHQLPETAVRIFTGAPLPVGADAVIEQEAGQRDGDHVIIARPVNAGRNVMPRGHQYVQGQAVYQAGERLTHSHLGTLAGLGVETVPVYRPLRVAIVQTGNELTPSGRALGPGRIYEVQARWVPLLIADWGGTVTQVRRVGDDLDAICQALETVIPKADLVLTSGGISVGDYDYVARALEQVADPLFWRVAMHPGKAVGAARRDRTLILALSGNPAAALTSWSVLAAPWWAAVHQGLLYDRRGRFPLRRAYPKPTRETRFLRVKWTFEGLDWDLPHSMDVLTDPWDSGYALVPEGSPPLPEGTVLTYWQPSGLGGTQPLWHGTASGNWTFQPPEEFGSESE